LAAVLDPTHAQTPAQLEPVLKTFTSPFYRDLLADRPAVTLPRVHCPVLALGGSKDVQVPAALNLAATAAGLQAGHNRDVTTKELPGLNHLFQTATTGAVEEYGTIEETFSPTALQLIGDWIAQHAQK
jgi:pimeloyl-ACP methyl ester carboxylesterase